MISTRRTDIRTRELKLSWESSFARFETALLVQASEVPYVERRSRIERKVSLSPKLELHHRESRDVRKVEWAVWHIGGGRGDIAVGLLDEVNEAVIRDFRTVSASGIMSEEWRCVIKTSSNR
jgi:hypothetical protein